jgi:hypothetical protein
MMGWALAAAERTESVGNAAIRIQTFWEFI